MERLAIYSHSVQADNIIDIVSQSYDKIEYHEIDEDNLMLSIVLAKKKFRVVNAIEIYIHQRIRPDYKLYASDDPLMKRLLKLRKIAKKMHAADEQALDVREKLIAKIETLNTEIVIEALTEFHQDQYSLVMEIAKEMKGIIYTGANHLFGSTAFWNYDGLCILNEKGHTMLKEYQVVVDKRFEMEENCTDRQLARKDRSEAWMKQKKIPIDFLCACIQDDTETQIRSLQEVASRALALFYVGLRGENYSISKLMGIFKTYTLENKLTPYEKAILLDNNVKEEVLTAASWRFESMWVMLWALGYVKELSYPDEICDVHKIEKILLSMSEHTFVEGASMVIRKEILDEADLYHRLYHFISKIDDLEDSEYSELIGGVITERYFALMWLIQYGQMSWDEMGTSYDKY